jgi:hypothetical protein
MEIEKMEQHENGNAKGDFKSWRKKNHFNSFIN